MSTNLLRRLEASFQNDCVRVAITSVIQNSFTRCLRYSKGPIHTALILSYVNLEALNPNRIRINRRAIIFLNLRTSQLFGLRAEGDIDGALTKLQHIANYLRGKPYDESNFAAIENQLNANMIGCNLRILRHAPVYPDVDLCATINRDYGAGQIKRLARTCAIDDGDNTTSLIVNNIKSTYCPSDGNLPIDALAELDNYFGKIFNVDNPAIINFRQRLDADAMKMLTLINRSFPMVANQIGAYNWLNPIDPVHKRNRKQAALQILWLMPIILKLKSMPWMPERMGDSLPIDKFESFQQSIMTAIDSGTALFELIAQWLNVSRAAISKCRYRSSAEFDLNNIIK